MFTGLIEGIGTLIKRFPINGDVSLHICAGNLPFTDVILGESIAINGVCLTVIDFTDTEFFADVSSETLALTTLGQLTEGCAVNLERALRPTDRLGGHLVSGHVDGVGYVEQITNQARAQCWRFKVPDKLLRYIAVKGSICVDGVSLTVNAVDNTGFEVALIPHTLQNTAFHRLAVGTAVNLEVDMLARYVERLLSSQSSH